MHKLLKKAYCDTGFFDLSNPKYIKEVKNLLDKALEADSGSRGDITTNFIIERGKRIRAAVVVKQSGILAGSGEITEYIKKNIKLKKLKLIFYKKDGQNFSKGDRILRIEGSAADILLLERTILNFLQRLSGIATMAGILVQKVPENVLLCPTRKTIWGIIDKKACIVGGAGTHRLSLSDGVLIKNTHLNLINNDFTKIYNSLKNKKDFGKFVEIEVTTSDKALKAAEVFFRLSKATGIKNIFTVMFDNMPPDKVTSSIKSIKSKFPKTRIFFEASGGINLQNIKKYAKTGVDIISIGALTNSAPVIDMSLRIEKPTLAHS